MSNHDYKITTMTCSVFCKNTHFDIKQLYEYLELNKYIKGIKSIYGVKGIISSKKSAFKNQITFNIVTNKETNSVINVKLFNNGSIHFTGCKKLQDIHTTIQKLNDCISNIQTQAIVIYKDRNNVLTDTKKNIYSLRDNKYIYVGYKQNDEYIIKNKSFKNYNGYLINSNQVYNTNLDYIGELQIYFVTDDNLKYKKIYYDYINSNVLSKNKIVGKIIYPESSKKDQHLQHFTLKQAHVIEYSPNINTINDYEINIDCINITFDLHEYVNQQELYHYFKNKNIITKFTPDTYSGLKIVLKGPEGRCTCKTKNLCLCDTITFLVFRTGKIISCGYKSLETIPDRLQLFHNFLNSSLASNHE